MKQINKQKLIASIYISNHNIAKAERAFKNAKCKVKEVKGGINGCSIFEVEYNHAGQIFQAGAFYEDYTRIASVAKDIL